MKSINEIKQDLLSIIAQEQVAFQFSDGLISFTKPDESYDSSDIELGLPDEVKLMQSCISKANSIKQVNKPSLLSDELGFAEFATWSTNDDTLILVDDYLLLCLRN